VAGVVVADSAPVALDSVRACCGGDATDDGIREVTNSGPRRPAGGCTVQRREARTTRHALTYRPGVRPLMQEVPDYDATENARLPGQPGQLPD